MVHVTNDAWFGTFSGPWQHLALARLRAAEQGLPVLRAANTGVSAVIDARGRVLDALPLGEAGYLDARLPPPLPPTVYARMGDAPVLMFALVMGRAVACGTGLKRAIEPARATRKPRDPTTASWRGDTRIMEHPHGTRQLPLHLRVRFGGASRQGLRPDFRRRSRRVSSPRNPRRAWPARPSPPPAWS
jgi:hypothetical protein